MVTEILIVCFTLIVLFGPCLHAKAAEMREKVRKMEIENDQKELE